MYVCLWPGNLLLQTPTRKRNGYYTSFRLLCNRNVICAMVTTPHSDYCVIEMLYAQWLLHLIQIIV